MQRVIPPAVRAVLGTLEPVVQVRAVQRPLLRLRVVQDLSVVPQRAVPVAQRLALTAVPAEQALVVSAPRVRAVPPVVAQARRVVPGRAVLVVPRPPGPVVQPQPVLVVLVVIPLAAIAVPPAGL
jgi:hypothetical protein